MKKIFKILFLVLMIMGFQGCTTYIDSVDSLRIDVSQSNTALTIDPTGVQDDFYLTVKLNSETVNVELFKYEISYNEVSSAISREGSFLNLYEKGEEKQLYMSLMTKEAFDYLKVNKMMTANIVLYFRTQSGVVITKDIQVPILYTTETK